MVAMEHYEEHVEAAIDAGVDIIISGAGLPLTLPAHLNRKSDSICSHCFKRSCSTGFT